MLINDRSKMAKYSGLGLILALCVLVYLPGIWWGLPSSRGWAPDEVLPADVRAGTQQYFSSGWHRHYPPLQFYLLAMAAAPFRALAQPAGPSPAIDHFWLFLAGRALTLLMALGMLVAVYQASRERDGSAAAPWAVLAAGLMPPLAYYAKIANLDVPYLMWFAFSMRYYLRLRQVPTERDLYGFAATAALAVCTKDQAYGFYVLPVAAVTARYWKHTQRSPRPEVPPRRIALAGAAFIGIAVFALVHNLAFNLDGFREHVRVMVGPASVPYRMFGRDWQGQLGLLTLAILQLRWVLGWPAAVGVCAGLWYEAGLKDRGRLLWLLLPAVSYYLSFLSVVGYLFDRFLLGAGLLLALPAGHWLGHIWAAKPRPAWRRPLVLAGAGFALATSVAVSTLMIIDGRYAAERWLRTGVPAGATIVGIRYPEYLPRPEQGSWDMLEGGIADLKTRSPDYVIVNEDFVRRFPPGSEQGALVEGLVSGNLGYRRVFETRVRPLWLPLSLESWYRKLGDDKYTNLDKISPAIAVYRREAPATPGSP